MLDKIYSLSYIAGTESEFEKASRLTAYFAPKLIHKGDYANQVECNALELLNYSFENPLNGINCVNKSKILQECCLAIGLYARRVWLMPYSPFDCDNHVVNEIFDKSLNKWIMLDITSNGYFVDENEIPLSVMEMRDRFAFDRCCCFKKLDNRVSDYFENFQAEQLYYSKYFAKNLFYFVTENENCFGDKGTRLIFLPLQFNDASRYEMNKAFRLNKIIDNAFENCKRSRSCDIQSFIKRPF